MKRFNKVNTLLVASLFLFGGSAYAESPACGDPQDDSWMEPEIMQEQIESLGYTIESMGVSEGNCYEVTGLNVQGKSVTAYFDPRTGGVVQEDVVE